MSVYPDRIFTFATKLTVYHYTLDASVIMNAFSPAQAGHTISLQLQAVIQFLSIQVYDIITGADHLDCSSPLAAGSLSRAAALECRPLDSREHTRGMQAEVAQ
jgi:hypothetical protein